MSEAAALRHEGMASVERLKAGRCPDKWKQYLSAGEDAYFYLPYLATLVLGVTLHGSEEESAPPNEMEWLKIASEVPMVFDAVRRQLDDVLNVTAAAFRAAHVEKKSESSGATSENGTGSPSPETSGAAIRTS